MIYTAGLEGLPEALLHFDPYPDAPWAANPRGSSYVLFIGFYDRPVAGSSLQPLLWTHGRPSPQAVSMRGGSGERHRAWRRPFSPPAISRHTKNI